jgi:hypothetical protein
MAHQEGFTHGESCNQGDNQESTGPQSGYIEVGTS